MVQDLLCGAQKSVWSQFPLLGDSTSQEGSLSLTWVFFYVFHEPLGTQMEFCPGERVRKALELESSTEGGRLEESLGKPHLLGCHIYFGQSGEIKTRERPFL